MPVIARDLTAAVAALAVTVFLLDRFAGTGNPTTVALTLLLVVLATATLSQLLVAIITSMLAMIAFNYFFLPPVRTLTIADPQNWVALVAFLVVAVIASNLSAAAHERAREATDRRNEVTRLFDLSRDVLLTTETAGALGSLARHIARRFELSRVAVCVPAAEGWHVHQGSDEAVSVPSDQLDRVLAQARGTLEFDARRRSYGGHAKATVDRMPTVFVPLRLGLKPVGVLVAADSDMDPGTLDALGGLAAIAIERVQFLADRDAAELVRQKADLASTLLAALSHDLRTPLTVVRVAVENLRREDLAGAERREQAQRALAEIDRLTGLFQDILDMARIDAAAVVVDPQWVTPADIVDAAVAHVRHSLEHRPLTIEADTSTEVRVDPRLTSAALSHLVENAARYSPDGAPIEVVARADGDGLRMMVRDRGPGLDPAELERLFERFYRGRAARKTVVGTGLGLSITRGLLAAERGRVWAENATDGGARFTIVVPAPIRALAEA